MIQYHSILAFIPRSQDLIKDLFSISWIHLVFVFEVHLAAHNTASEIPIPTDFAPAPALAPWRAGRPALRPVAHSLRATGRTTSGGGRRGLAPSGAGPSHRAPCYPGRLSCSRPRRAPTPLPSACAVPGQAHRAGHLRRGVRQFKVDRAPMHQLIRCVGSYRLRPGAHGPRGPPGHSPSGGT